jgi:predicted enzyme related to lactoylglutathione lyase
MTTRQPDGWQTLTTRVVATDPERLVQFLRDVFHDVGDFRPDRPAEMRIGDSVLMVSGADERSPFPAFLYIYVDDADAVYRRALAKSATSLEEPMDTPYGDRRAMVRDSWGNVWQIATRGADVADEASPGR